ncbi:MAG: hypothetical protein ABW168_05710 [Sedimenticola sp.]
MTIDVEKLLQEVAAKHGLVILPDDPIIAAVTLNDIILDAHTARIAEAQKSLEEHMATVTRMQVERSREIARTVIGDALEIAKKEINDEALKASEVFSIAVETKITALETSLQNSAVYQGQLKKVLILLSGALLTAAISIFVLVLAL